MPGTKSGELSIDQVQACSDQISDLAARLDAVIAALKENGDQSILCTAVKSYGTGYKSLSRFVDNLHRKLETDVD